MLSAVARPAIATAMSAKLVSPCSAAFSSRSKVCSPTSPIRFSDSTTSSSPSRRTRWTMSSRPAMSPCLHEFREIVEPEVFHHARLNLAEPEFLGDCHALHAEVFRHSVRLREQQRRVPFGVAGLEAPAEVAGADVCSVRAADRNPQEGISLDPTTSFENANPRVVMLHADAHVLEAAVHGDMEPRYPRAAEPRAGNVRLGPFLDQRCRHVGRRAERILHAVADPREVRPELRGLRLVERDAKRHRSLSK